MWRSGRRLHSTAGVLMILTAMAHTAGNLAPNQNFALEQVMNVMRSYHLSMGMGMSPSVFDIFVSLSWTMSFTFTALGILTLIIAGSADTTGSLLRKVGWLNVVWVGAMLVTNILLRIPPPLICAATIEAVLLMAVLLPAKSVATT